MTCDARAAQAEGLRRRGGREEGKGRGEGNEIVLVNSHGKAFYLLLPPLLLLLLLRQFSNCSTCSNNFGSPPPSRPSLPPAAGNACVRFIYAFINQLTKCEFLQRVEIKR